VSTLGGTFVSLDAAASAPALPARAAALRPVMAPGFVFGLVLLLGSLALGAWQRSRRLGGVVATAAAAATAVSLWMFALYA
jgi:hypothetical protein